MLLLRSEPLQLVVEEEPYLFVYSKKMYLILLFNEEEIETQ
jgi:hypothetical protein